MIVRDEVASIGRCLVSVRDLIDYWTIVDTGSTDDTKFIVQETLKGIPGELYDREWVNFGHNRSELLALAREKTKSQKLKSEFLLLPDADDELVQEAPLPELAADCYNLRYEVKGLSWRFPRLIRTALPWYYVGAAHSYLDCDEKFTQEDLDAWSFRHDGGGKDRTKKFKRDAELLAAAAENAVCDTRSWFYLAQSYKDMGLEKLAAVVYEHRASLGGWPEEVFYSLYQCGVLRRDRKKLFTAWRYRPSRAEPLYWLARIAREQGRNQEAIEWASKGLEIPYPEEDKLFVHRWIYEVGLEQELDAAGGGAQALPASQFRIGGVAEEEPITEADRIWLAALDG